MKKACSSKIKRRAEFGGVDLIQFVTALVILGIAAASAAFSLSIGRGALENEYRKKKALELARNEIEYWTGFIYEGQDGMGVPFYLRDQTLQRIEILDYRSDDADDDIVCRIVREPVTLKIIQPGTNDIENYGITIHVIWDEPTHDRTTAAVTDSVSLSTWMIYKRSVSGGGGTGGGGGSSGGGENRI